MIILINNIFIDNYLEEYLSSIVNEEIIYQVNLFLIILWLSAIAIY
jgi:hypothetical protein